MGSQIRDSAHALAMGKVVLAALGDTALAIRDQRGRFAAALGISMSVSVFDAERDRLAAVVSEVAAAATPLQRRVGQRRPLASVS